jgi:hypothetical protein
MALVGKGSISTQGPDENARRKQTIYRWNLRTTECRDFVRELYPYLVAKQQQARILIGCPSSGERAEAAHAALISLHRTGSSTVDFPAPTSMFEPGWYVRSDIVWGKANPMPESVTDRPTKSHEYLFLLTKSARYYYDADAVRETAEYGRRDQPASTWDRLGTADKDAVRVNGSTSGGDPSAGRNLRTVWTIATAPYPGAHFATFPPKLVEPCVKAGAPEKVCGECGAGWRRIVDKEFVKQWDVSQDTPRASAAVMGRKPIGAGMTANGYNRVTTTGWSPSCAHDAETVPSVVLDPFAGSGTVGMVAQALGRRAVLIDLNGEYLVQAMGRNNQTPLGLIG